MSGKHTAPPSALDVVTAALATELTCPHHDEPRPPGATCRCIKPPEQARTAERAALIVAALTEYGYLPSAPHATTLADVQQVARWLAEKSGFARYTVQDGWSRIMASEADVNVAASYAVRAAVTDTDREDVGHAKAVLLTWHHDMAEAVR